MFYSGTAVLMAEVVKLISCLWLVFKEQGFDSKAWTNTLYQTVWIDWKDTLKVSAHFPG